MPKPVDNWIIEQLIEERLDSGMTMTELAKKVGVSASSISYWESGDRRPKLDNIMALAEGLGLELRLSRKRVEI